jgi:hypothetical protein
MKAHGLLLEHHSGTGQERRHDGRVAIAGACPSIRARARRRRRGRSSRPPVS